LSCHRFTSARDGDPIGVSPAQVVEIAWVGSLCGANFDPIGMLLDPERAPQAETGASGAAPATL